MIQQRQLIFDVRKLRELRGVGAIRRLAGHHFPRALLDDDMSPGKNFYFQSVKTRFTPFSAIKKQFGMPRNLLMRGILTGLVIYIYPSEILHIKLIKS